MVSYVALFESLDRKEKRLLAKSIVHEVRRVWMTRFLQKDPSTSKWEDVGDERAIEKTCQVLREAKHYHGNTKMRASSSPVVNEDGLFKIDLDVSAGSDSKCRRGRELKDGMLGNINGNGLKRKSRTVRSNLESRRHSQQQRIQLPAPMPPVIADANDPVFRAFREYQASVSEGRPFLPFAKHPVSYSTSAQQPAPNKNIGNMSAPLGPLATYNAQEQILQSLLYSQQQQTLWNTNSWVRMSQGNRPSMDWIGRLASGVGQAQRLADPSSRACATDISQSTESIPDGMNLKLRCDKIQQAAHSRHASHRRHHSQELPEKVNPTSSLHELAHLAATQKKVFHPCHPANPVPESHSYIGQPMITGGLLRQSDDMLAATQYNARPCHPTNPVREFPNYVQPMINGGFVGQSGRTLLIHSERDSNNRQTAGFDNGAADLYLREVRKQWESGKRASLKPGENSESLVDSDNDDGDEVQDSISVSERKEREGIPLKRRRRHSAGSSHDRGQTPSPNAHCLDRGFSGKLEEASVAPDHSHSGTFAYQVSPSKQQKRATSASTFSVVSETSRQLTGGSFTVFDRCHSHAFSEISAASVKGQFDDADSDGGVR